MAITKIHNSQRPEAKLAGKSLKQETIVKPPASAEAQPIPFTSVTRISLNL